MMGPSPAASEIIAPRAIKLALAGDVMLARGIDQILQFPSPPTLYEAYARSALVYVSLAEKRNGPVPRAVPWSYIWGDMIADLAACDPDFRIINLETAVAHMALPAAEKGIHYRLNPANLPVLDAASIDCCVLANNHVLDWGRDGLQQTLASFDGLDIAITGAGRNDLKASAPAILSKPGKGRVLVYGFACPSGGVPIDWAAKRDRPGVRRLDVEEPGEIERIARQIESDRQAGDIVVASIHWGPNWGYGIADADRSFAHRLIDEAQVDIIHGHSSHHPKGVEFHRGKPILYGCGDLVNDYEGIGGEEAYRPDLVLLYLLEFADDGTCRKLAMLPYRIARFRLVRATGEEARWLADRMDRECAKLGSRVMLTREAGRPNVLEVRPHGAEPADTSQTASSITRAR